MPKLSHLSPWRYTLSWGFSALSVDAMRVWEPVRLGNTPGRVSEKRMTLNSPFREKKTAAEKVSAGGALDVSSLTNPVHRATECGTTYSGPEYEKFA